MKWQRIIFLTLVLALIVGVLVAAGDPLNRFIFRLELSRLTGQGWRGGFWTQIDLPKSVTPQNLVDRLAGGDLYEVLEAKEVFASGTAGNSTKVLAALVDNAGAKKICLFQYVPWTDSWEGRIYDL